MKDSYAGDITDFVKFGLLRTLFSGVKDRTLGVVWFLTDDRPADSDGRKTRYLLDDTSRRLRRCDSELYDQMAAVAFGGNRSVGAIQAGGILPGRTTYFDERLSFEHLPKRVRGAGEARLKHRAMWIRRCLATLEGCDFVFLDPDNGMEVCSAKKHQESGVKYVFFDELERFYRRNHSLIVIQFGERRRGSIQNQVSWRVGQLRKHLQHRNEVYSVYSGLGGARMFFLVPSESDRAFLRERARVFHASAWKSHATIWEH